MRAYAWRKWLKRLFGVTRPAPLRRPARPRVEALEGRWVPAITPTGQNLSFIEGQDNPVLVATFTDTTPSPAADYTATIDWGDGGTSPGTVVSDAVPLSLTGFNQDVVFETGANPAVSRDFDSAGFAWFQAGATDAHGVTHSDGLPTAFVSLSGTRFRFQNFAGNNVLLLDSNGGPTAGTLTLTTPASYGTLAILASSSTGSPSSSGTVTVHYTDNTTATFSYNAPDWITTAAPGAALPDAVARSVVGSGNTFAGTDTLFGDAWQMFETDIHPDPNKQVASLDFSAAGPFTTGIFAVSGGSGGSYSITGSHTYADEGSHTAAVTFVENNDPTSPISVHDPVTVAEADTLTPLFVSTGDVFENELVGGPAAVWFDAGYPGNDPADFDATFDWGDGTTYSTADGNAFVTGDGAGNFTLSVDGHAYADEGVYTVVATLSDSSGTATDSQTGFLTVNEADSLAPAGSQPNATLTEGDGGTSADLGVFTDTGYPNNSPSDFTATIDWGDGATTAGTVSGAGDGTFTVSGSHAYAEDGTYHPVVTLADDAPGTASATATATVTVLESSLALTPVTINATEGQTFSGTVAFASDPGSPDPAGEFSATIDWGDDTSDAGTVTGSTGHYTVGGSHVYADEGTFTATVTFAENDDPTSPLSVNDPVTVAEADVLSGNGTPVSATEASAFTGQVATFTDTNTASTPGDFTATIDWGDGTTDAGTVTGGGGSLTVSGSHTYADEGTFPVIVVLADGAPGTASATAVSTATVAEADVLTAAGTPVSATETRSFTGTVATFTDTNTASAASDFTATIDWGDGQTSAGTVSGAAGSFTVSGSHTYAEEGSFPVTVVIADNAPGTATATAGSTAAVAEAFGLTGRGVAVPALLEGTPLTNVSVATFDHGPNADPPSSFGATIDWGDGTTSAGAVVLANDGYHVLGSHTYAEESIRPDHAWPVTVLVSHGSGQQLLLITSAGVLEKALPPGSPDGPHGTQYQRWLSELYDDVFAGPITAGQVRKLGRQLAHGTGRRRMATKLLTPGVVRTFNRRLGITAATPAAEKADLYFRALLEHPIPDPPLTKYTRMLDRFGDRFTLAAILKSDEYFRKVAL